MKAFKRFAKEKRAARLENVKKPFPKKHEVLIQVSHCGICGSDLHAWLNHKGYESVLSKVTFGHELSGTIVEVGDEVKKWKQGQAVVMIALQTKHETEDFFCKSGLPQLSHRRRVQGLHLDGGMAEFVCIDQEFILAVPENLSMELAALTEPLSVAEHCIENRTSIKEKDRVIVSGPGIIGILCAISARARGAEVLITGTEKDEGIRLTTARKLGFQTRTVGSNLPPLSDQLNTEFSDGADALIEASGAPSALAESWRSVRPNGVVTAVALYSRNLDFNMTPFVRKQIDLRTSYASASPDYIRAFKLLSEGKVNPKDLISTYPLENAEEGFKDSENLKVMKAMLICKD